MRSRFIGMANQVYQNRTKTIEKRTKLRVFRIRNDHFWNRISRIFIPANPAKAFSIPISLVGLVPSALSFRAMLHPDGPKYLACTASTEIETAQVTFTAS